MQYTMPTPRVDRNGTYCLRYNIPKAIKTLTSKTCIKKSLGTKSKTEAYRVAYDVWLRIVDELNAIKNSQLPYDEFTVATIDSICAVWYEEEVKRVKFDINAQRAWALEEIGFPFITKETYRDNGVEQELTITFFWNDLLSANTFFDLDYSMIPNKFHSEFSNLSCSTSTKRTLFLLTTQEVRQELVNHYQFRIQPKSAAEYQISKQLLFYFLKLKEYSLNAMSGKDSERYRIVDIKTSQEVVASLESGVPLKSAGLASFTSLSAIEKEWGKSIGRKKTERKANKHIDCYSPSFRKLRQFIGDCDVSSVTLEQIRAFREVLYELPGTATKSVKELPLRRQAQYATSNGLKTLAANTVRNHIVHLSALFDFGVKNGYMKKNVAKTIVPSKQEKSRLAIKLDNLTSDEIEIIFSQQLFTARDFTSFARWKSVPKEACYWVPILCYYFGARVSEVTERYTNHVFKHQQNNFYIFRIDESSGAEVKESSSVRDLPIPDALIELGLIEYVESLPNNSPLFSDPRTEGVMKSTNFRKAYAQYLKGIKGFDLNNRAPMHCFRHTMETMLRELEVQPEVSRYITGRARQSSSEVYGSFLESARVALNRVPKLNL
jgi:integrase